MNIFNVFGARNFLHQAGFEKWQRVIYEKFFSLITKTPNACKIQVITKQRPIYYLNYLSWSDPNGSDSNGRPQREREDDTAI